MQYNKLSKEEIIKLANNGDPLAMIMLGDFYNKLSTESQFNDDYFQQAKSWYELASKKGNLIAVYKYIICINFEAVVAKEVDFTGSKNHWEVVLQKTLQLLYIINKNRLEIKSIDIGLLYRIKSRCIYYISIIDYFADDIENAFSLIVQNNDKRSKILYSLCEVSKNTPQSNAITKEKIDAFENSMRNLKGLIEFDLDYMKEKKEHQENVMYYMAILLLCQYYSSMEQHDNAVHLLRQVLSLNPNNESNDMLEERLSHYKKKIFGGYQYIQ